MLLGHVRGQGLLLFADDSLGMVHIEHLQQVDVEKIPLCVRTTHAEEWLIHSGLQCENQPRCLHCRWHTLELKQQ